MDKIIIELTKVKIDIILNSYRHEIKEIFFSNIDYQLITQKQLNEILNKIFIINGNINFVLPLEITSVDDYDMNDDEKQNIKKILLTKMSFDLLFQEKSLIEFYIEKIGKKKFVIKLYEMMKALVDEFNLINDKNSFLTFKNNKINFILNLYTNFFCIHFKLHPDFRDKKEMLKFINDKRFDKIYIYIILFIFLQLFEARIYIEKELFDILQVLILFNMDEKSELKHIYSTLNKSLFELKTHKKELYESILKFSQTILVNGKKKICNIKNLVYKENEIVQYFDGEKWVDCKFISPKKNDAIIISLNKKNVETDLNHIRSLNTDFMFVNMLLFICSNEKIKITKKSEKERKET